LGESIQALLEDISHIDAAINKIKTANERQILLNKTIMTKLKKFEEEKNKDSGSRMVERKGSAGPNKFLSRHQLSSSFNNSRMS